MFLTIKLYLCKIELFETKLIICIKMDLALNNLQSFICYKPPQNQPTNQPKLSVLIRPCSVRLFLLSSAEKSS